MGTATAYPTLTIPAQPRVALATAAHLRRCTPALRPVIAAVMAEALRHGHPLALVQSRRYDHDQIALYAKGRAHDEHGHWVVTDPGAVVTQASTVVDTAHGCTCGVPHDDEDEADGCAHAVDFCFLVDGLVVGPKPGKGNDSFDADMPWIDVGKIGEAHGLQWGGRFGEHPAGAGNGWDAGHLQLRNWRALRELRAAELRARHGVSA